MPRRGVENRPSLNESDDGKISKGGENSVAAKGNPSSEAAYGYSSEATREHTSSLINVQVEDNAVPMDAELVLVQQEETVATSSADPVDMGRKETPDAGAAAAATDGSSSLSLEALCQAAKSELQNISKEKAQNGVVAERVVASSGSAGPVGQVGGETMAPETVYKISLNDNKAGASKDYIELVAAAPVSATGAGVTEPETERRIVSVLEPSKAFPGNPKNVKVIYTRIVGDATQMPMTKPVFLTTGGMQQAQTVEIRDAQEAHSEGVIFQPTGGRRRKHPAKPGRHICPYCGRGCAKPSVLEKHIRAHTGERPYPCTPCGISFKTKSNLYKHCKSRAHQSKIGLVGSTDSSISEMELSVEGMADDGEGGESWSNSSVIDSSANSHNQSIESRIFVKSEPGTEATQIKPSPRNSHVFLQTPGGSTKSITPPHAPPRILMKSAPHVIKGSPQAVKTMLLKQQPDGTILLKPQIQQVLPKVESPSEVFLSTLRVPVSTSTPTSQVDPKHVTVRSKLEKISDKSMKVTIQLPKLEEVGSGDTPGTSGVLRISPSQLQPMTAQISPVVHQISPAMPIVGSASHFVPVTSFVSSLPTQAGPAHSAKTTAPFQVTSSQEKTLPSSVLSPADVTARISYLIDKNQAIVNTPMSEAPRPKRVVRQRSEMFGSEKNQDAELLGVQKLNRAQSMDVSLLNKETYDEQKSTGVASLITPPLAVVPMKRLSSINYVTAAKEDRPSDWLRNDGTLQDRGSDPDADPQQELHDECGDAVVVLQQLHDPSSDEERALSSQANIYPPRTGEEANGNHSAMKDMLLRKSTNSPHPLLHHSENSDSIVQPSLYNYKCGECNEEMLFADIKSIEEHVQRHQEKQISHVTNEQDHVIAEQNHVTSEKVTVSEARHLLHSRSVDVSTQKSRRSQFATPSRSLDSVEPADSRRLLPAVSKPSTSTGNVVLELVDPTQPPKRGRPKGARNVPKGQSNDEPEKEFYFGSTRTNERPAKLPSFISRSLASHDGPPLPGPAAQLLSFGTEANTHVKEVAIAPRQKEENEVKLKLKDKILMKRSLDVKKNLPLEMRQLSAPVGADSQPIVSREQVTSSPSKGKGKEQLRLTRSLDDPPPRKRPKLTRQQSVVDTLPSERKEKIQRQFVVENALVDDYQDSTEQEKQKNSSKESVPNEVEQFFVENVSHYEKEKSPRQALRENSPANGSHAFTVFTPEKPNIPLITLTSDDISGSKTEILSDVTGDSKMQEVKTLRASKSEMIESQVQSFKPDSEDSVSKLRFAVAKSVNYDYKLTGSVSRQEDLNTKSRDGVPLVTCSADTLSDSTPDTSQGNLIILECDNSAESETESIVNRADVPEMNLSKDTKNVLCNLFGLRSNVDLGVKVDKTQPVTNRGTVACCFTPPSHAPCLSSTRLQSRVVPLSVARRIPGMVKITSSVEMSPECEGESHQSNGFERDHQQAKISTDQKEQTDKHGSGVDKHVDTVEVKEIDDVEGRSEKDDASVSTERDRDNLDMGDDRDASKSEKDLKQVGSGSSIDVVTNQSKYTVEIGGKRKSQSQSIKQMSEDSMCGQSEILTELPPELQENAEVLFTLVGHQYPVIRTNTHTTLCSVHKPQPMYVTQDKNPALSMYSTWRAAPFNPNPEGLSTKQMLRLYRSRKGDAMPLFLTSPSAETDGLRMIHSNYANKANGLRRAGDEGRNDHVVCSVREVTSKYKIEVIQGTKGGRDNKAEAESIVESSHKPDQYPMQRAETDPTSNATLFPDAEYNLTRRRLLSSQSTSRVHLKSLGFKSEEDYTYVRGRGRGKYVCKECGIRCKKPSMLKKHVRTHTDLRPFVCKYCTFAFKTKGNLTKHMKSKSHHKKCLELGLVPVPTVVDDTCIESGEYSMQTAFPDAVPHALADGGGAGEYDVTAADDGYQAYDDNDDVDDEDEQEVEEEQVDMDNMVVVDAPDDMTAVKETDVNSREPRFIAIQHREDGEPMLLKITTDTSGQTRSEVVDLGSSRHRLTEGFPRDSADKEVAASLLDLSTRGDKNAGGKSTISRGIAFDVADSQSFDSQKSSERLESLIGKLIHRTVSDEEKHAAGQNEQQKDPAFDVINHPMLYSNIQSKSPTPSAVLTPPAGGQSDSAPEIRTRRKKAPGSGFVPPTFSENEKPELTTEEDSSPRVVLKIPGSDNMSERDLDGMIKNILKQVPLESKQKIVVEIQLPEKQEAQESASALLSSEAKEDDLGTCVNPQEIHADHYSTLPVSASPVLDLTGRHRRLTDSQIRQMDPSLQDSTSDCGAQEKPQKTTNVGLSQFAVTPPSPRRLSRILKRQASFNEPDQFATEIRIENPRLKGGEVILQKEGSRSREKSFVPSLKRKTAPVQIEPIPGKIHKIEKVDGSFECHLCKKLFPESALLQSHLKVHAFDLPYRCSVCNCAFRLQDSLDRHVQSDAHLAQVELKGRLGLAASDNPRPYQCVDCGVAFRIHGHLAKHLRSKSHIMTLENVGKLPMGTYIELERSQFLGMTISALDSHSNLADILSLIQRGKINVDTATFKWPPGFKPMVTKTSEPSTLRQSSAVERSPVSQQYSTPARSISLSTTPHKCGICGRSFGDIDLLKEHLVSHAEIRPYVCHYCDAGFTTARSLETHLATHTESQASKRFICEECHLDFDNLQLMLQHFKVEHNTATTPDLQQAPDKKLSDTALHPETVDDATNIVTGQPDMESGLSKTSTEAKQSSHSSQEKALTPPANRIASNEVTDEVTSSSAIPAAANGSQVQQSVQIIQGSQEKGDGSKIQVIQLNPEAFELKEVLQRDEQGVERLIKVMVINWDKVPPQQRIFDAHSPEKKLE